MKTKTIVKICIVLFIIILIFLFRDYINIQAMLDMLDNVKNNRYAPLIFVLIYAISVTLIVPAGALTLISAPLFGFWYGLLLTIIGSNLGCHLSYLLGKLLGEDFVKKFIKSGSFIAKAKDKATANGFIFMMYARLIPLFPFAAVNYLSAIIGIKYKHYTIATFIGMIPGSFVYVYLGYSASNISENPLGLAVSISVLVLFTLAVTFIKKRADKKESGTNNENVDEK